MVVALLLLSTLFSPVPRTDPIAIPAAGCHQDVRVHRVPEYRLIIPHFHRPGDCAPIIVEGGGRVPSGDTRRLRDCHADVRRHPINGVMIWHRHVGPDCAVRRSHQGTVVIQ
jgi:hypothetical protein